MRFFYQERIINQECVLNHLEIIIHFKNFMTPTPHHKKYILHGPEIILTTTFNPKFKTYNSKYIFGREKLFIIKSSFLLFNNIFSTKNFVFDTS